MSFYKKPKSTSVINKRRKGPAARIIPWAQRFGVALCVFVLLGWVCSWFFLSGTATRTGVGIQKIVENTTANMGFRVSNIMLEGRKNAERDIILALVNMQKGSPLLAFNPAAAQEQIERVSWVERAEIERRLPDTIYIRITERQPLAFWQQNNKLRLIDTQGKVIATDNLAPFKNLPVVVGQDSEKYAPELIANLKAEPIIFDRVDAARRVSDRRWDLILKNKIEVKLPENDMALAISRLAKAQTEDSLLDKDIEHIDLRSEGRMIVRTRPGAVQEYNASLNTQGNNI